MRCLKKRRQVLIDVRDDSLNFLQSARARIRFVLVVERFQQIQILAGLRRDILNRSSVRGADLLLQVSLPSFPVQHLLCSYLF